MSTTPRLRIGELAQRTGVAPELLRAWERRYGLLAPSRTPSGYRLYSEEDVARVLGMRELVGAGVPAAEAARRTLAGPAGDQPLDDLPGELRDAIERLDDAAAQAALDRLLAGFSVGRVVEDAVLPLLHDLGERWASGAATVGQEHFASNLLRGRLLGLARGWDRGSGPRAVLACPAGERHDVGLVAFGLGLREHGWRITFLGADTPSVTIVETVAALKPAALVLAVTDPSGLEAAAAAVAALAGSVPVWIGGAGAAPLEGARLLDERPFAAAARVAAGA
jgi:DNA-binding transcriptional MerR regulator/methylmalonyl-CoA mutase cobalamin-binding subunit